MLCSILSFLLILENIFRFRNECPDGKLTKQHLKTLFEKVFPDGIQSKINAQYKSPSELFELASELELFWPLTLQPIATPTFLPPCPFDIIPFAFI